MQGFEHEITEAMTEAYATACKLLGLTERAHPAMDVIAMKIIRLAQQGETDSVRLCQGVMTHCGLQECSGKWIDRGHSKPGPPH